MILIAYLGRCCGLSEVKQGDIWKVSRRRVGRGGLSGAALVGGEIADGGGRDDRASRETSRKSCGELG